MGLAVKESIVREATWTQKLINELLMSMTFNLADTSNAVTFIVAYGSTRGNTRMWFGRILMILLLVECPAATIYFFNRY